MDNPIILLGAGGHSKVIIDTFIEQGVFIYGIIDDYKQPSVFYRNVNIIHKNEIPINAVFFPCIGDNTIRSSIIKRYKGSYINCIDKKSHISDTVKLGVGNYIGPYSIISADCNIGNFNIINNGAIIGHDTQIGDYCHISLNSNICGGCFIKDFSFLGAGSTINPKIIIEEKSIIGSNSVIVKNTLENSMYVGVPGIKKK